MIARQTGLDRELADLEIEKETGVLRNANLRF